MNIENGDFDSFESFFQTYSEQQRFIIEQTTKLNSMSGEAYAYLRPIPFNMVNSDTLKDAMANPENYKNLLVRISGYKVYIVALNKEMQKEIINRAEYGL